MAETHISEIRPAHDKGEILPEHSNNLALLCPSAQPDMEGCRVLGVVGGTAEAPRVAYLNQHVSLSEELVTSAAPVKLTEVLRLAAHCEGKTCRHFDGTNCNLATRIVQILPVVVDSLPACLIRPTCRWYQQEGRAACMRCPQVITENYEPSEEFLRAALG